ncbi:multidrug efflux system outer membrane protein [Povalibacter uvarum]|uniref:Multidrug efflux system outer membrane protein n=1 Tax=Povalibacter uvarum TaxID=732238 RepID=A0A841HQY9_9GAMM|nr:efflux transporter outer membrane subunit [Povalibacter uvarum]MBB6095173.1 multidrug efflux system outer membrane protein [Povalibacter uvarum]
MKRRLRTGGWLLARMLVVAGALAGCAIGPDYERPESVKPPDQYRAAPEVQTEKSIADVAWARMFGDPELAAAIRVALSSNLDLLSAVARVEEFRAQQRVARSAFGPDIRATVSTSPNPASTEDASYSGGLSLTWELDLFGRIRRSNEAARAQLMASEDNARAVMSSLVAAVATTWFQLREIDAEIQIIRDTIRTQEESLALVQSLLRNGVASGAEEQQAIGQLATTRAQLPLALQQRAQIENFLQFLLGNPPDEVQRSQPPTFIIVPPDIPVGLPAQLLERRPDVRLLEQQLHAATAQVGVAQASRFPHLSIGLTSFFGIISPQLSRLLDGDEPAQSLFAVGPSADMPIFQSGRGNANVAAARAVQRQAEFAYRSGVLQALREVADTLVATDQVREVIAQNEVRTGAAAETLRLQRMRYRAGVISYIEVLDGERQLFAAQIDLARARLSQLQSYIDLYRALGGGWSDSELQALQPK